MEVSILLANMTTDLRYFVSCKSILWLGGEGRYGEKGADVYVGTLEVLEGEEAYDLAWSFAVESGVLAHFVLFGEKRLFINFKCGFCEVWATVAQLTETLCACRHSAIASGATSTTGSLASRASYRKRLARVAGPHARAASWNSYEAETIRCTEL